MCSNEKFVFQSRAKQIGHETGQVKLNGVLYFYVDFLFKEKS